MKKGTHIIDCLTGLIDGNNGSRSRILGRETKRFHKLQGVGTVKSTGTVIPALQGTSTKCRLCNADTLPLTSRDTTNILVSDLSVDGMRQTEHGHDHAAHMDCVLLARDAGQSVSWGSGARCEVKGVPDCHLGEMGFGFSLVDDFSSEVLVHLLPRDTLILDIIAFVQIETMSLT